MRRFHLKRVIDETGISGVGIVTEGVQFSDGSCVMRWMTDTSSTTVYASIQDVLTIHGHAGKTLVQGVDDLEYWKAVNENYLAGLTT